jgi:hypothetical protein
MAMRPTAPPLLPLLSLLLLQLAATTSPAATASASGGGPLLPCGTTGNPGGDSQQVLDAFNFVKAVCGQVGEVVPVGVPLPTTCATAECQRAVRLVADSCDPAFRADGFLKTAFGAIFDVAAAVCAAAHPADATASPAVRNNTPTHARALSFACPLRSPLAERSLLVLFRSATSWLGMATRMSCPSRRRPADCSPMEWAPADTTRRGRVRTGRLCRPARGRWRS